jgi:hypothetical protein
MVIKRLLLVALKCVNIARYLSFYRIDVVKFVFILQENISAKENKRKIKVESYLFY